MTRRSAARLAAGLSAALVLAGCGGGGGGGGDSAGAGGAPVAPASAPATGVSAVPTDVLFGSPEAATNSRVTGALPGYDEFGTPRDAFKQLVSENSGGGTNEASSGPTPTSTAPVVGGGVPTSPVPGATPVTAPTTPATPAAPGTGTPATAVMEADFDIGGEPVVARVGDAIPPGTQQFTVERITSNAVTLKLNGGLLPSGSDAVALSEGESITLYNQTTRTTYKLRLLDIRKA